MGKQGLFDLGELVAVFGAEETVVPDFVESFWEDVSEEAMNEVGGGKCCGFPAMLS